MKVYKLTELIQAMSENEFKKFGDFVRSPAHNRSAAVVRLYELIEKNFENFQSRILFKKVIAEHIYPNERYSDQNIRTLFSNFTRLLEKFLAFQEMEKDETLQSLLLVRSLQGREASKNLEATARELNDILEGEFNCNEDHYHKLQELRKIMVAYKGENLELNIDADYYKLAEEADMLFVISKLKTINSLLSRKYHTFGNIKLRFWCLDEILNLIKDNLSRVRREHPIIYSEYLIFMMMLYPKRKSYFQDLKKYVLVHIGEYKMDELEEVYYSLTNYCFNKVNVGERSFLKDLYSIYRKFETNKFYHNLKRIQYPDFISIILNSLHFNDVEWADNFFFKYKHKITPEFKKDTSNLSSAMIHFCRKKYDEAIRLASDVHYRNSYFYLNAKEILVKIYYELGELNALESVMDAMRHYLRRHRDVLLIQYDRYMKFLNLVTQLTKISSDGRDARRIKKDLERYPNAIGVDWLKEKVRELGNK